MIPLSTALSARFLFVLLAVCFVLLVLVVLLVGHAHLGGMPVHDYNGMGYEYGLILGHAHLGGIPVLAESTMSVVN